MERAQRKDTRETHEAHREQPGGLGGAYVGIFWHRALAIHWMGALEKGYHEPEVASLQRGSWRRQGSFLMVIQYIVDADDGLVKTQHVLWRLEQGLVTRLKPKYVVLQIGANNLEHDSAADIATGIDAIIQVDELINQLTHDPAPFLTSPRGSW